MISHEPILITGCARSGTSLIAGILHLCGAWKGETTGATRYNRRGQFENSFIRQHIIKPYLKSMGCDPLGQNPLPDINNLKPFDVRSKVLDVITKQGYKDGHWMLKGAKYCLIWPLWKEAFPDAKWIIVRRKTEGIINSCMKTFFMRAYRNIEGWGKWVAEHEKRFKEMFDSDMDVREVWSEKVVAGDFTEIKQVVTDCGLQWNEDKVKDFVSPELYHK